MRAAFLAIQQAALARIDVNARGVLTSDDAEFLHQLRVGMRRLRSALRAFRKVLPRKRARRVARALRKLSPKLGAARDWDVLVARLADHPLRDKARRRQVAARRAARRVIGSKAFAAMIRDARRLETKECGKSLAQVGAGAMARARRKLQAVVDGADWSDPVARHAIRIRVKRLRYTCEFFAEAGAKPYVEDLKALQEILGGLNDIAVGRRLLAIDADETAALRRLRVAWARFAKRPPFWRAAG